MLKYFLAPLALALYPLLATAADADAKKPYRLQIVLRVAQHRLLTPIFKDQLRRELREGMQAALGAMGRVEVVEEHPLLSEVEAKGLRSVLDSWRDITEIKTHFVLVDFVDGQYEIQARQHDGYTGLASPVVRKVRTADRQFVGRTAALLLDRDFGLIGTLDMKQYPARDLSIVLQGAGLGAPLERWVKKDEVFAIAQVTGGERRQGSEVAAALLQVTDGPRDGICHCRLLHRFKDPLERTATYRCLKLGTTEGPLRLRFVDDRGLPQDVTVRISPYGFGEQDAVKEEGATKDGYFALKKYSYSHVAYVRVSGAARAQVPVCIFDDDLVTVQVRVDEGAEERANLDDRSRNWQRRVFESIRVQADRGNDLAELIRKGQHQDALKRAEANLKLLQQDHDQLAEDLRALRALAGQLAAADQQKRLDASENELQKLDAGRQQLEKSILNLKDVIAQENDPKRQEARALVAQGRLREDNAEYGQAIELYEKALELTGAEKPPELVQSLEALKTAWAPKGDAHVQARTFIYSTWPTLKSYADIQPQLAQARKAFETCRAAGDRLSPWKLLLSNVTLSALLLSEQAGLRTQIAEENDRIGKIKDLLDQIRILSEEVNTFLSAKAG
jgi:tetratricopeptide (TPR) repeat protein